MKVPANRQRIIFQGKLLNNSENLNQLKVILEKAFNINVNNYYNRLRMDMFYI